MKNWIKVIFALNPKLDALTYSIDGQVDCISSLIDVPTVKLFDDIMKLNDRKIRIINLRVLHDKMKAALSSDEHRIIQRSARGYSFSEIGEEMSLSKGQTYRIYVRAIQKLSKLLTAFGYTAEKFLSEYDDVALVKRTYKKLCKMEEAS